MSYWEDARQRLEAGESHESIYQDYSDRYTACNDEAEEDRLLDVLDALTGYCSPQWDLRGHGH